MEEIAEKHVGQKIRMQFVEPDQFRPGMPGRIISGVIQRVYNAPSHLNNEPRFTFHEDGYAHPHEYTQRYWRVLTA